MGRFSDSLEKSTLCLLPQKIIIKKKQPHLFSSANVNTVWVVVNSDSQRPLSAHSALRG